MTGVLDEICLEDSVQDNPRIQALIHALQTAADDYVVLQLFLRDLLTMGELEKLAKRWAVADELLQQPPSRDQGRQSQQAIADKLGVAQGTVNDVSKWVTGVDARGGFVEVWKRMRAGDTGHDQNH